MDGICSLYFSYFRIIYFFFMYWVFFSILPNGLIHLLGIIILMGVWLIWNNNYLFFTFEGIVFHYICMREEFINLFHMCVQKLNWSKILTNNISTMACNRRYPMYKCYFPLDPFQIWWELKYNRLSKLLFEILLCL